LKLETGNWKSRSKRSKCQISSIKYQVSNHSFTLIELLVVIVVLGILFGLITAAIGRARENAKSARLNADTKTLETAIWAYRHEYGKWPYNGSQQVQVFSNDNYKVREYMEDEDEEKNPRKIRFVNWSEYSTNGIGTVLNPWGTPYVITVNTINDTVTVQ